jgi:hypothetical protein
MSTLDYNDKQAWCEDGRKLEDKFVEERRFQDVEVRMNPAKEQDIFTYDMRDRHAVRPEDNHYTVDLFREYVRHTSYLRDLHQQERLA